MKMKDVKIEKFDSLSDFLDVLKNRKENEVFESETLESKRISDNLWSGTRTYEQADKLIRDGYDAGLKGMDEYRKKIKTVEKERNRVCCGVVGFAPIVPNAIVGMPLSMVCTKKEKVKRKTVRVFVDVSTSCNTDKESILKRGRELLDEIIKAEVAGFQIEVVLSNFLASEGHVVGMLVRVKKYGQRINPLKCAYLLAHPSMLRRHVFRWLETYPELEEEGFTSGYGYGLFTAMGDKIGDVKNFLLEKNIIKAEDVYINMEYYHENEDEIKIKIR